MHSINAYVTKKEFFDGHEEEFPKHVNVKQDFVLFLADSKGDVSDSIGTFVNVNTDYFGGFGDQSAVFYRGGANVFQSNEDDSINQALAKLGVSRSESEDEFDSIGLGNYRSEQDIINKNEIPVEIIDPSEVRLKFIKLLLKLETNLTEQVKIKEDTEKLAEENPDYDPGDDDIEIKDLLKRLNELSAKLE